MGGRHAEDADRLRMMGDASAPDHREFARALRALYGDFGKPPAQSITRLLMSRVASRWVTLAAANRVLAEARRARSEGKGRRPSPAELARLAKRAGLEDSSFESALTKLREHVAASRRGGDLASALADRAARPS